MIKKNERFPIEISKTFYTVSGSDSLNCRVTQSEVETIDLEPQEVISESTLEDLGENRVAGEPIEITFTIDNDQILICTFKDPKTGKNVTLEKNLKK